MGKSLSEVSSLIGADQLKRGVLIQTAVGCGITSKGPWRSSKTPGIQQALSNDYLKKVGLFSLRDGWIAVQYPNQEM